METIEMAGATEATDKRSFHTCSLVQRRIESTYKIINFLGLVAVIGRKVKAITKQATDARMHMAKIINRSQRLTASYCQPHAV